jgi:hypothetical protein
VITYRFQRFLFGHKWRIVEFDRFGYSSAASITQEDVEAVGRDQYSIVRQNSRRGVQFLALICNY